MYKSFNQALEIDLGHKIRMNENFSGWVEFDDLNVTKLSASFSGNRYVNGQEFKFMNNKSGEQKFVYVIDINPDNYDVEKATSKPMLIYRKRDNNSAEVYRQGIFRFNKRVGNRLYFVKMTS